jgi:hypothetical protein
MLMPGYLPVSLNYIDRAKLRDHYFGTGKRTPDHGGGQFA